MRILPALALLFGAIPGAVQARTLTEIDQAIARHLAAGASDSATALVSPALEAARAELGETLALAAYTDSLGIRFFEAYEPTTGLDLLEQGVALREALLPGDDIALAAPLEQLSTAYYVVGRLHDAVRPQERAIAIKTAVLGADDPTVASGRYELALIFYRLTRYDEAERELRTALATFEKSRDAEPMPVAEVERVLGETRRELNRYDDAESLMLDAVALARGGLPAGDPDLVVFLNSLAGFYKDQARYDEAELLLEEALDIRTRAKLDDQLAVPNLNLAEIYRLQGRTADAIPHYQRALAIAKKTLPPIEQAEFHNQLAAAYAEMDRPRDAEAQYRQALAVVDSSQDASPQVMAQFKNDLGVLLAREGRADEGAMLLEEAIALREGVFGARHPLVAVSLTQLARAQAGLLSGASERASSRDTDAARLLDRALAIFDSTDAEPEARVDAGIARAQIYHRHRDTHHATSTLAAALDDAEALRPYRGGGGSERIAFVRRYVDAYDRMTEWQVESHDNAAALGYSERRRARVLVDQLMGMKTGAIDGESIAALDRLRAEKRRTETELGACQARVDALRSKARPTRDDRVALSNTLATCERLASDLQRTSDRIRSLERGRTTTPSNSFVPPSNSALLVYHIGSKSSFAFLVEGGNRTTRAYRLEVSSNTATKLGVPAGPLTRATLARLMAGYDAEGKRTGLGLLRQLATPNSTGGRAFENITDRLRAAFELLVPSDVWTRVRGVREVVVIPDGALSGFPFEACVVGKTATGVTYWLDDGPVIRYAPSMAALDALVQASPAPNTSTVLSVCNPHYADLPSLPGTQRETEAVVAAFGGDRVDVLCGDDATEAAVRGAIGGKKLVHLATHGLVGDGRSDLMSSLALTPAPSSKRDLRNDGFLHLFEIYDLSVAAELVVLSACESSTGDFVLGEGVMALSRGFLSVGAKRVVATQWKVDDAATASLVGDFLARVAAAEKAKQSIEYARFLRDAKRVVRATDGLAQPFYWAAFVLTGVQ